MLLFASLLDVLKTSTVDVVIALLSTLSAAFAGAFWLAKRMNKEKIRAQTKRIKDLSENVDLANKNVTVAQANAVLLKAAHDQKLTENDSLKSRVDKLHRQLTDTKLETQKYYQGGLQLLEQRAQLRKDLSSAKQQRDQLVATATDQDGQLRVVKEQLEERISEIERGDRRIKRAIKLDGFLWTAKALQKVPKFKPQSTRQQTILSVLNLKGGVGKTTLTANLGIALARRGYRVLLVDLDLQGSLTDLLLPTDKIEALNANRQLIQHFFTAASFDPTTKLADYVQEVHQVDGGQGVIHLIGASDNLGYTELSLTLRWLLVHGYRDNRFLLRKALHLMSVANKYDFVLIDCPPLVNMSCINALAASDGLLVPVTLDSRATERVPVLLKRVLRSEKFKKYINHDLKVYGIVANRTFREALTAGEAETLRRLADTCQDAYGSTVNRFKITIPSNADLRDSQDLLTANPNKSRAATIFDSLALELENEVPHECRNAASSLS